jgi:hypothetical protein
LPNGDLEEWEAANFRKIPQDYRIAAYHNQDQTNPLTKSIIGGIMTNHVTLKAILLFFVLTVAAFAQQKTEQKTFTGTWTCLACDMKGLDGSVRAQCEELGHRHCLRLDNGDYVFFLDNDHSHELIMGGGRHEARVTVTGTYFKKAHTIDIQSYTIDGITSAWCPEHGSMDHCVDKKLEHSSASEGK